MKYRNIEVVAAPRPPHKPSFRGTPIQRLFKTVEDKRLYNWLLRRGVGVQQAKEGAWLIKAVVEQDRQTKERLR